MTIDILRENLLSRVMLGYVVTGVLLLWAPPLALADLDEPDLRIVKAQLELIETASPRIKAKFIKELLVKNLQESFPEDVSIIDRRKGGSIKIDVELKYSFGSPSKYPNITISCTLIRKTILSKKRIAALMKKLRAEDMSDGKEIKVKLDDSYEHMPVVPKKSLVLHEACEENALKIISEDPELVLLEQTEN